MSLRTTRIILQILSITALTACLSGLAAGWLGWMAKIQFIPSVFRVVASATLLNITVLAAILLVTFVFGRIYCSVVCPLGILQDFISWLRRQGGLWLLRLNAASSRRRGHKPGQKPFVKHFRYRKENKTLRRVILAAYILAVIAGIQIIVSFLAPYATYARFVNAVLGNSKPFVAIVSFVLVFAFSWLEGRLWCQTVCPVGTLLGILSRRSLFKPVIDKSKCSDCGRCERGCKSSCIDAKNHTIDTSRCVDCFDCISRCKEGAISFRAVPETRADGAGRRKFLSLSAIAVLSGANALARGKVKSLLPKQAPARSVEIVPPGAGSRRRFHDRCIACGLCITACPNKVLAPSSRLENFMQPEMNFDRGFCRPECTACSEVCPTGAILPITREEKSTIKIGTARIDRSLCVINTNGDSCGNCASKCPSGAIRMTETGGRLQPVVVEEECIGCGKCEYLCPARPVSAIVVDGIKEHRNG